MTFIEVTLEDIALGIPGNACGCPIARAAKRAFPGRPVEILTSRMYVLHDYMTPYPLPVKAQNFIKRFDQRRSVQPFSFWIESL